MCGGRGTSESHALSWGEKKRYQQHGEEEKEVPTQKGKRRSGEMKEGKKIPKMFSGKEDFEKGACTAGKGTNGRTQENKRPYLP